MPGDPKECRQHALNCVRLAQDSNNPINQESILPILPRRG